MSDQLPDEPDRPENRALPVLWGLLALVAVAVIVGGVLAVGASVATKATGLADSDRQATAGSTRSETLYLPDPTETGEPSQSITLPDVSEPPVPKSSYSDTPAPPKSEITLFSAQDSVGQMEKIELSGTYPNGDGAVLQVQQFRDGAWTDFPVNVSVNGDQYSTFIQASMIGENRFRVVDTDTDKPSNEVRVTIS